MKLPPAAIYASSTACDAASSAVHPNTLVPRQSGKISRSAIRGMRRMLRAEAAAPGPAPRRAGRSPALGRQDDLPPEAPALDQCVRLGGLGEVQAPRDP